MQEKGTISINTDNIFPIIKKFLYSDHEIFLRELVSNAVDACRKLENLARLGEAPETGDLRVTVSVNKDAGTITVSDNGIGMTADEIKKYINQIAFSGATEFVEKYKDKAADARSQIIGNFGLGFYSSFMVADLVEIDSLSYTEGAQAAHWSCNGSTDFELTAGQRTTRGTDIVLHVNEESKEFVDLSKLRGILMKYCRFMPIAIYLDDEKINETQPLWNRPPAELKEEDYINFYRELYPMAEDPMFWIHLNVDYPFNLTGVLYFPKVSREPELQRNKIQLYSRQVFITDDVKDIVPEFLLLLHGVIDSPDIPLNVSRSYLQADANVKKITGHINKKVADKLTELFKANRDDFSDKWKSLGLFVKYGMMTDDKFYDRAKDFCLLSDTDGKNYTIEEYKTKTALNQTDKNETLVWLYTDTDKNHHARVEAISKLGYSVLLADTPIDPHFISLLERKLDKTTMKRVDSEVPSRLIDKGETPLDGLSEEAKASLKSLFEQVADKKEYKVSVEPLATDDLPVLVNEPEFMRRMKEMSMGGGMGFANFPDSYEVVVNANHRLVMAINSEENAEKRTDMARHALDLGLLAQGLLTGAHLTDFIRRSAERV